LWATFWTIFFANTSGHSAPDIYVTGHSLRPHRTLSESNPGLPDGLFSSQKSKFGFILEGLGMGNVDIFHDHLEYFMAIWYNLWQFGIVRGHLVYFSHFGMFGPRQTWSNTVLAFSCFASCAEFQ
jgi:hypothetical protein